MIRIGKLNKQLVIEEFTRTPDGAGGAEITWADFATVWAAVRSKHGAEKLHADAPTSTTSHEIVIRYVNGLHPRMRFMDGTRKFEILSIINVEEKDKWLSCLCREKT